MPEGRRAVDRVGRSALALTLATATTTTILGAVGVVPPSTAVLLLVAVEVPLTLAAAAVNAWRYRTLRHAGHGRVAALEELAGATATRMFRAEVTTYRSLWLWARRRVDGQGPGVHAVGYARGSLGVPLSFGVLTVVEAIAIHLVIPWAWLRTVVLVASVYSLVHVLGFVASRIVHPHLLISSQLTLRSGAHTVATLDRDALTRVIRSRRHQPTVPTETGGQLYLPSQDGTNIDLHLTAPASAHLPGLLARHRRRATITVASIHLDDLHAFLDLISDAQRDPLTTTAEH